MGINFSHSSGVMTGYMLNSKTLSKCSGVETIFHLCHFVGSPCIRLRVNLAQRSNPFQRTLTRPCMLLSTIQSLMMMIMWRRQPMVLKAKIWICVYKIAQKLEAYDFFMTIKRTHENSISGPVIIFLSWFDVPTLWFSWYQNSCVICRLYSITMDI